MNEKFLPILNSSNRYTFLEGGSGSGKSYSIALKIIYDLMTKDNCNWLCVRKVARTLRSSCFHLLRKIIKDLAIEDLFLITESFYQITCKMTRNTIIMIGCDDPEKIKSISDIQRIWIEEATELCEADFRQIDLRLRGLSTTPYQIMLSYNPCITDSWLKRVSSELDDSIYIHSTYHDNKFCDEQYKKTLENLKFTNPDLYEIYAKGLWNEFSEARIFKNVEVVDKFPDEIEDKYVVFGLDQGFTDPTVCVKIIKDDINLYIQQILFEPELDNGQIINRIKHIIKNKEIYIDNARPELISEFKSNGINAFPCRKGKDSVINGINFLKQHKLYLRQQDFELVKAIKNYNWRKGGDRYIDEPCHEFSHGPDAIRDAVYTKWFHKSEITSFSRTLLGV
jgi:phage terminase large subunit